MKFICAQPAIQYYTWQVEVMINNFIRNGVNPEDIHIVCGYGKEGIYSDWNKLVNHYKEVKFFFYPDTRVKPNYISSIRLNVLHQHWIKHPELEDETIFYHDCDIIFSKPIEFDVFLNDDVCYLSDTISYIGAQYVRSKGEHYLDLMTSIVNVNKNYVIANQNDSGGAQYLLKKIPTKFWEKAYYDAENLYRMVNQQIKKDNPPHAIQIWCADMWAVLWNLWVFDKTVKVSTKLAFSWATSTILQYDNCFIYHNAGVVGPNDKMFFKGMYQNKTPYNEVSLDNLKSDVCSIKYAEEILKTKEVSCLK